MECDRNWLKCPSKDPNRSLRTSDIWQYPRKYLNKPNYNLSVSDIDGAQPRPQKSNLGIRRVNPLNPNYKWSKTNVISPKPLKFLRNTLNIDDIWGAKPARCGPYSIKQRDNMNYKDIDKSFAGWNINQYKRKNYSKFNQLNVKDINNDFIGIHRLKGNRCTNPLDPQYQYNQTRKSGLLKSSQSVTTTNKNNNKNILGSIKGSKPQILNRFTNRDEFNLRTHDIYGAQINHHKWKRNIPKDPNYIGDIEKTAPNSNISFKTRRCTNPLNPKYKYLDYRNNNNNKNLQRNKSTPSLSNMDNNKKLNNSKSSAILAPVIPNNKLTKKNMMNKFEKEQHSQQIQDDISSVRSLTLQT